jgi:hypothetical protein
VLSLREHELADTERKASEGARAPWRFGIVVLFIAARGRKSALDREIAHNSRKCSHRILISISQMTNFHLILQMLSLIV